MQATFERSFYLRTSDFDLYKRLQPASVLDLFQDAAGAHAALLGIGGGAMEDRELIWVLTKVKFQFLAPARMFQRVRVKTWPLSPGRLGFQREYLMEDEAGQTLVKGSSQWVLVHREKRCFMPVKDVYPAQMEFCSQTVFDGKMLRIRDFEPQGEPLRLRPGFSQLDINEHVNNTKYANYALDALVPGPEEIIDTFQIDFHREVQAGTALHIHSRREENCLLACGRSEAGENMFACRIELK